jgi:hypothetical protein
MKRFMRVFSFALSVVAIVVVLAYPAGEGRITGTSTTLNEATNSMADWFTMKPGNGVPLLMSAQSGNITVATTYGSTMILKGFYNPRRDSSVYIKCRTQQSDTIIISVPTESWTPKLPPIDYIFKTGTKDSIYLLFQKR